MNIHGIFLLFFLKIVYRAFIDAIIAVSLIIIPCIKKSDGSWKLCVDYRSLNQNSVKDKFHIPFEDKFFGVKYFSKLDLRSGYHQVRIAEDDIPKTTFKIYNGHYEILVMPFGIINVPSTFQNLMEWSAAVNKLKQALLTPLVLSVSNFKKDFLVESDASGTGLDVVLMQKGNPIVYMSHKLKSKGLYLSAYVKEMMVVLLTVKKWMQYLLGRRFIIKTDQKRLKYLLDQKFRQEFQSTWLQKHIEFDYPVQYPLWLTSLRLCKVFIEIFIEKARKHTNINYIYWESDGAHQYQL